MNEINVVGRKFVSLGSEDWVNTDTGLLVDGPIYEEIVTVVAAGVYYDIDLEEIIPVVWLSGYGEIGKIEDGFGFEDFKLIEEN